MPLLGRDAESATLRALISGARNGVGGALLLTGDPGVGKTSLLTQLAAEASGVSIITVTGFDVESGLPFAALQRLGRPLGRYLAELPERQRSALLVAGGIEQGAPPERALVGLAALSLIARAGDDRPVVCIVDDAQHLDAESLEVLGFVSRRLAAESVALVFASRPDDTVTRALAGVTTLDVGGLDEEAAVQLVDREAPVLLDPVVARHLVAHTGGNPLALTELAAHSSSRSLLSAMSTETPAPIGARLEEHYSGRVDALSAPARLWLLVAAAESTGDAGIVRAAARALDVPGEASDELETSGLLAVRDEVRFRHPMVRAAVYSTATDVERRRVHAALRAETAARGLSDLSTLHGAAAAAGADPEIVGELVALADRAGARGGLLSRAGLLVRAAALAADADERAELQCAAAEAAIGAGAARLALDLVETLDADDSNPVLRGRVLFVRAMAALFLADPAGMQEGSAMLVAAADAFSGIAPVLEQRVLLQALNMVQATENTPTGPALDELGVRFGLGADAAQTPLSVMLRALSSFILDPYEDAVPHLTAALAMMESLDDATLLEFSFVAVCPAVGLWDQDAAARILSRAAAVARDAGALRELDAILWVLSAVELSRADPRRAGEYLEQARDLRRALGYGDELVVNAAHLAWVGAPASTVEPIIDALVAGGWRGVARMGQAALAISAIADGEFASAYTRLVPLVEHRFLQSSFHHLPEFVEAAVRTGHRAEAERVTAELERFAAASGRPWILAAHERALALLARGGDAEGHHLASLEQIGRTQMPGEQGRAHLLYGEWLRRERRRREAREHLHAALDAFETVGAVRFAGRARRELEASGEIVTPEAREAGLLTPQEDAIARLASSGATNAEIGTALLISPNTVDYHLRKIFRKLGVTSRRQLSDSIRDT